uniref:Zeta toxin domain-containing protein n=1 Tax=Chromera velia CCMP2878 TaxID=1169474 RepID=A0A0G4IFR4_9ALVE|eukprot:Cvel_2472.t1-p1 / transcript=Cvel_2472.t1 / gene=Cvel_2472 / organism=Chromera_velia_CCMP2878 / gene_product=hypothetical protein / transcript_product=hypothetical protein / location=Cvel_scaffold97:70472-73173(-) / protein_length=406 / sequence_SO=supercontig / SO=protein_coding / is_pseudo=false
MKLLVFSLLLGVRGFFLGRRLWRSPVGGPSATQQTKSSPWKPLRYGLLQVQTVLEEKSAGNGEGGESYLETDVGKLENFVIARQAPATPEMPKDTRPALNLKELPATFEPHRLVSTASRGARWEFTPNFEDFSALKEKLREDILKPLHDSPTCRITRPIVVIGAAPGTGKSRLLQEFPRIIYQACDCEAAETDDSLAFWKEEPTAIFNVGLDPDSDTPFDETVETDPEDILVSRMLYPTVNEGGTQISFREFQQTYQMPSMSEVIHKYLPRTANGYALLCIDCAEQLPGFEDPSREHTILERILRVAANASNTLVQAKRRLLVVISATSCSRLQDFPLSTQRRVEVRVPAIDAQRLCKASAKPYSLTTPHDFWRQKWEGMETLEAVCGEKPIAENTDVVDWAGKEM